MYFETICGTKLECSFKEVLDIPENILKFRWTHFDFSTKIYSRFAHRFAHPDIFSRLMEMSQLPSVDWSTVNCFPVFAKYVG